MKHLDFAQFGLERERQEPMWVCQDCLGDSMLKKLGARTQEPHLCEACGQEKTNFLEPSRLAAFIGKYLPMHFEVDFGLYPGYEQSLAQIVQRAIGCASKEVCEAVARCLERPSDDEEGFFWPGQTYSRRGNPFDDQEHERWYVTGEWHSIARDLMHGQRFFNPRAQRFFESLVGAALGARRSEGSDESAISTMLPEGTYFYRARAASSRKEVEEFTEKPAEKLGAPPLDRAANNRMSASGIPLLYVAKDIETSIAEIRPSIGDLVVVGRFRSTKTLTFFDFNVLGHRLHHEPLSFFEHDYEKRDHHRILLEYLHDEIARPTRFGDVDYVMTQALAEFIRFNKPNAFDGISFRSVQNKGGVNYVLFDRHSHAELGRARFDVTIESADVSTHEISQVKYRRKDQDDGEAA
ncbi:RES family NAD+ phosphorylase [Roseateles noduli]|uniref:RES family NAD+ phosphorylase n=1 Tax=Roseateles noduli TaxID=2052484 RepID=UPI003D64AEDE